jgi:anaerobic selenocysteine-containing dehydrogenase
VLPATTQFEHVDVQGSWGHHYVLANSRAFAPLGEARSSGAIMRGLAEKLGLNHPVFQESDEEIAAASLPEGWSFEELKSTGWRKSPTPRPAIAPLANKLRISDGPIEVTARPTGELQLLTPKGHYFLNSTFANMPRHRRQEGQPMLRMCAFDAASRGLADGAPVVVRQNGRSLALTLAVSSDLRPGCVALDGKWWNEVAGANTLTASRWSPAGQPAYNEVFVTVESAA